MIVLIDSLTRFAEDFAGPEEARDLFDAGQDAGGGHGRRALERLVPGERQDVGRSERAAEN